MIPFEIMNVILTGNKILDSIFGQGAQNLANDAIGALQLIGSLVVIGVFIYAGIKKSKEEEQSERKRLTNWQIALVIIEILIVCAKDIFELAKSYFM